MYMKCERMYTTHITRPLSHTAKVCFVKFHVNAAITFTVKSCKLTSAT